MKACANVQLQVHTCILASQASRIFPVRGGKRGRGKGPYARFSFQRRMHVTIVSHAGCTCRLFKRASLF